MIRIDQGRNGERLVELRRNGTRNCATLFGRDIEGTLMGRPTAEGKLDVSEEILPTHPSELLHSKGVDVEALDLEQVQ